MLTQIDRMRNLFESRPREWISLPEILRMGIAQYNARIFELRRQGMRIVNRMEMVDGVRHTWFMYQKPRDELF